MIDPDSDHATGPEPLSPTATKAELRARQKPPTKPRSAAKASSGPTSPSRNLPAEDESPAPSGAAALARTDLASDVAQAVTSQSDGPGVRKRKSNQGLRASAHDAAVAEISTSPGAPEEAPGTTETGLPVSSSSADVVPRDAWSTEVLADLRDFLVEMRGQTNARATTDLAIAAMVQQQQAMIVRLDQAARRAQSVEVLRHLVGQFLRDVRVRVVTSVEDPDHFPGIGTVGTWEVVEPAYVDLQSGRLVQPGRVAPATEPTDDPDSQEPRP